MKCFFRFVFVIFIVLSCDSDTSLKEDNNITLHSGNWRLEFLSQGHQIPIQASINGNVLTIINAEETIDMGIEITNDSFYVTIPNFDSHLEGLILSDKKITGLYIKDLVEDYAIPFTAEYSQKGRFAPGIENPSSLKSKYEVSIDRGDNTSKAIGLFKQTDKYVVSNFATETGDYRFLEGVVDGNKLSVSTFDGSHLFLFTADIKDDSLVNGLYISGKTGNYKWKAIANESFELGDPEKLTSVNKGSKPNLGLKFLSTDGDSVALSDEKFNGRVKIVQIMGTWCPNCLDETRYFNTLYSKYKKEGLEIIAVAFERGPNIVSILEKLNKYKKNNNIEFTMLYGGKSGNKNALEVFPYLDKVMSFPTAIYFDKNNNIRKVYTGFYGPGTGKYYTDYALSTENFIGELLAE